MSKSHTELVPADFAGVHWQEPRDLWTIWVDLPVAGYYNGMCVGTFSQNTRTAQRRSLGRHVIDVMNDKPAAPLGRWERVANHSLACNGVKRITLSSDLPFDAREALLADMCVKLNGTKE